jgi:hypothetical protein
MQSDYDSNNCGVYVSWVLSELVQGNRVSEESIVDPLEFRNRILQLLREAPRHQAQQVDDDAGGSLDLFVIGAGCPIVRF